MNVRSTQIIEGRYARHLEKVREAELENVRPLFSPGARVLELGGATGYQASIIASWGCDVVSIDVPDRSAPLRALYYPVQDYDGENIPYPDESFDIVFSSLVLPSIKNRSRSLVETRRVLKPEGLTIHIVPSRTWRLWTSLSHPAWLLSLLLGRLRRSASSRAAEAPPANGDRNKPSLLFRARKVLLRGPAGEYPSTLSEFYHWSKACWATLLEENGFEVKRISSSELLYTGNALMPGIPVRARRVLARLLGTSSYVFVAKKSRA